MPLPPRNRLPIAAPTAAPALNVALTFGMPAKIGRRSLLFGAGGVGKTSLACHLPGKTAYIDLDRSLSTLVGVRDRLSSGDVVNVSLQGADGQPRYIATWQELLAVLSAPGWDAFNNIVIDTLTAAEEMAVQHTLDTVPQNKDGDKASSIEDYGYGKGYAFVFDTFMHLLTALNKHVEAGRNVVLICHDCQRNVANPAGADYLRFEPRLQDPSSGKASIRLRVREWCDDVFFVMLDSTINGKTKKAQGGNTRSVYTADRLWCMAKSRVVSDTQFVDDMTEFWQGVGFAGNNN